MLAKLTISALLALIVSLPSMAVAATSLEQLRAEINERAEEAGIVGLAYAIIKDGQITAVETFGSAEDASGSPITLDTRFRLGELSKIPTAIMLQRLLEQQQIDPKTESASAAGITNSFNRTAPLKFIHLLDQTSGLPGASYSSYKTYNVDVNPSQLAQVESRNWKIMNPPGQHYVDSHLDYTVAAAIAEQRTGTPFDTLINDLVLNPLGMSGAGYSNEVEFPYSDSYDTSNLRTTPWNTGLRPSMGLYSTIKDAALLATYLAKPETTPNLLSADYVRALFKSDSAVAAIAGFELHPGKGIYPFVSAGHTFWGGVGKIDGFQSSLGVLPETGDGFVLLANTSKSVPLRLIRESIASYASQHLSLPPLPPVAEVDHSKHAGWWVPIAPKSALSSWLWDIGGHVYLAAKDDGLQINQVLPGIDLRQMSAIDENSYRPIRSDKAVLQFFTYQGDKYLISSTLEIYRGLSLSAVLPYFALVFVALYAFGGGFLVGVFTLPFTLARAVKNPWVILTQSLLGIASASFIGAILLFLSHDLSDEFARKYALSAINNTTLTLATLSIVWPLCTVITSVVLFRCRAAFSARSYFWATTTTLGQWVLLVYLAMNNWVPLLTWNY